MNSNNKRHLSEQVRRFRARFAQGVGAKLGEVVPAGLLKQWVVEEAGRWRNRLYGPLITLKLFLEQVLSADQSCQDTVARGLGERVALEQAPCSVNTASYCEARKRLPLGLPTRLAQEVGARLCAGQPSAWRWRDREVKLVDGATVSMPDTPENQERFPQSRQQKPGLGFPLARVVAIVSLSCGAVLEWAVGACKGKQTGETALLWRLANCFSPGDVVVADRYYAGYFLIALFTLLGVDVVVRQHQCRATDFRRGLRLGKRDHVVIWVRPRRPAWMDKATYEAMPATLSLREVRVGGWTLVSTFTDAKAVHKRELLDLYRLRWQVELDLRSIKTVMQMDILRCKSPEMVCKEVAVHLLAYNLVRAVMAQAAHLGHVLPRELSFKGMLQLLRAFEQNLRHCPRGQLALRRAVLLAGIAQLMLPDRPGRVEPRAVKRRPKPHKLLTRPRRVLRKRLLKQQQRYAAACLT
ncbi:MAG: IS4 family transposase [Gammaproteobacteria bacterium]